jgi:hypothetical protein
VQGEWSLFALLGPGRGRPDRLQHPDEAPELAHALHAEHSRQTRRWLLTEHVGGRRRDGARRTVGKDDDEEHRAAPSLEARCLEQPAELRVHRRGDPHLARQQTPKVLQCVATPVGTGKSHLLVALGHAAVDAGHRVRYFSAAELVETLYRGLADNSVGKVIDQTLRAEFVIVDELGFAPLDDAGTQLLFRFVAAAYERVSLGVASHWPFDQWGRFLPEPTTAVSLLDRLLHHSVVVLTDGESFRMREAKTKGGPRKP